MKKILIVDIGKQYGGTERYVTQLATLFSEKYKFYFLVRKSSMLKEVVYEEKIGEVLEVDLKITKILKSIRDIIRYIKINNIEIIHTNGINSECLFNLISLPKKINLITTIHGIAEFDRIEKNLLTRKFFSYLQVLCLKKYNDIIAVSESVKNNLVKKGINSKKIHTIYHALDVKDKYSIREDSEILRICYVGRLEKVKNVQYIIESLRYIENKKKIVIDIYGTGSELTYLKDLVLKYQLQDYVNFNGFEKNINHVYKSHNILIQPSLYEAFGMTIIEAMSNGVIVLCSSVGGMKEIIKDKNNGFIFDINNPKSLSILIDSLLNNEINLETIRKNAYIDVLKRFNTLDFLKKMSEVYEKKEDMFYD